MRGGIKSGWRFGLGFLVIVALVILAIWGVGYGREWYGRRQVDKMEQTIRSYEKELLERAMADTFGGKTPQETLEMYIAAVESGDFVLASKYFVESRREFWEKEMEEISALGRMDKFLIPVKASVGSDGEYSEDKLSFSIYEPVGIDFILYPNGVWKIVEI